VAGGLRIVGGSWSGRRLESPPRIRPSTERTREALFSIWQGRVPGARFLDAFCGSGAAGLEALSRGASSAVLVDADARVLEVAARNRDRLEARGCTTVRLELPRGLASPRLRGEVFDLVFADPPYDFVDLAGFLAALEPHLAPGGEIALEHAAGVEAPRAVAGLRLTESRRYGGSVLSFYRRQDSETDCSRNEASSR